ncbi:MAG: methylenetetrahydrofolate--tRNA-(uracil(54)-C(5))-methyltransferase (FADH(2)-oxidizing) TrmFO [Syntrophorhabdaceae bacterium]|nr:methylenetetrahydrofolate--tRNA-(uracil(54)-C(5))-methyltransferase (FADH(2)-oxidizing) TrmFO [Syntrophorhabdaceae bacterium]
MEVKIIGGGLAGSEAAYQLAKRNQRVTLYEMRPNVWTPAHKTPLLSELVCSNSLKSKELTNAHGLLKEEMRIVGSLVMEAADCTSIPGGKALVVDREAFSRHITAVIEKHPLIEVVREEVERIPDGPCIIATGPLTSDKLAEEIGRMIGQNRLYFFDAISPIVEGDTIDMGYAFFASRYGKGDKDYLNCPLTEEEYDLFYNELIKAKKVEFKDFENTPYFEGCLPIEVMAERGRKTLLFGPLKPVGLIDGKTGKRPYAVVQLRKENSAGTMYNMVGFQTKLTYGEQDRVFRIIPALKNATFLRYGSIHRNTYIKSPELLNRNLSLLGNEHIFFAGQITGVEGYMESASIGFVAAISMLFFLRGKELPPLPEVTCMGALMKHILTPTEKYQPMNINFGLIEGYRKREKERVIGEAISNIKRWIDEVERGLYGTSIR